VPEVPAKVTNNSRLEIDSIDAAILNALQKHCRLSYNKVAQETAVSVGTAYNRIKGLQENGVIKSYSAILDSTKLGYSLTAVIFVQAEGAHASEVEAQISDLANVVAVYDVTGEYGIIVIAKFKDREGLNIFIKSLAASPNVKRTVTSVSLGSVKEDFRIYLP
jgi:DNA-binding Lrp family transcriptional regulator